MLNVECYSAMAYRMKLLLSTILLEMISNGDSVSWGLDGRWNDSFFCFPQLEVWPRDFVVTIISSEPIFITIVYMTTGAENDSGTS